jgi:PKD repeat protein
VNAQQFIFTNNSTIGSGSMTYELDFGDGNRQAVGAGNTLHSYSNSGIYTITLLGISDRYCVDSVRRKIVVAPKPAPAFSINDTDQCVNQNLYIFTNQSTITSGNMNYIWKYGDGNTFIPPVGNGNGSHTYNIFNNYAVTLVNISDLGCRDSVTKTLTVYPKPQPGFTINDSDQCLTGNRFNFNNTSSIAYGSLNYYWNFDDSTSDIQANPSHIYLHADTFRVALLVTSDQGCKDSSYKNSFVRPMPLTSFEINDTEQCINAQLFNFTNKSTLGYGVLSWHWDFGDGDTSGLKNPAHIFANTGNYNVTLVATSNYLCSTQNVRPVYVRPKPSAAFTLSDSDACVLLEVQFTDQSSSDVTGWKWDFDDPLSGSNSSIQASPSHTYYQPGIYNPSVIVMNPFSCFDTATATTRVYDDPVSNFAILPKAACDTPIQVQLFNQSINAVNYLWNFGNGKVSSAASPATIYLNTGTFNISLVSYSPDGCIDTLIIPYIVAAEPKASYIHDIDSGCMPLTVKFSSTSSSAPKLFWDFGDGTFSTDSNPVHIYNQAGQFPVLLATNNGNCNDTVQTALIGVWQKPTAEFNFAYVGQDRSGQVQFTDASSFADQYFWDFGDRHFSKEASPYHRYDLHGDYFVTQRVTTNKGCTDSVTHPVHIELMKGLFVGNAFTPEDNTGDARLFKPKGIGLKDYHVRVFTTWGELIWESTELENTRPREGWDGTWKGHPCKQDAYVWKIEATFLDGSVWPGKKMPNGTVSTIGTVTLIR